MTSHDSQCGASKPQRVLSFLIQNLSIVRSVWNLVNRRKTTDNCLARLQGTSLPKLNHHSLTHTASYGQRFLQAWLLMKYIQMYWWLTGNRLAIKITGLITRYISLCLTIEGTCFHDTIRLILSCKTHSFSSNSRLKYRLIKIISSHSILHIKLTV